jgi:hypothetical protein
MVALFMAGFFSAAYLALNQTALQLNVADEVRGRVLSVYLLTWGMLPLGQLAVGVLADFAGAPLAMLISCVVSLGCVFWIRRKFPMEQGFGLGREPSPTGEAAQSA